MSWAEYAVLEANDGRLGIDLRRVPLDLDRTLEAAHASGMPHLRWWLGRWDASLREGGHEIL